MKQLGQIETSGHNSLLKVGDVVRLVQPFRPERYTHQEYTSAIVAGIVKANFSHPRFQSCSADKQTTQGYQPGAGELIVYLYEPHSSTIYVDQHGRQALFSFDFDEIELEKVIQGAVF